MKAALVRRESERRAYGAMKIVFDIDGVLCDVWTIVGELVQEDCPKFSWELVKNYTLSGLSEQEKALVLYYFEEPKLFATPLDMYDREATTLNNWEQAQVKPLVASGEEPVRCSLSDWVLFFKQLREAGVDVCLHSVVHDDACAEQRRMWFNFCIAPFVSDVELKLDIGAKTPLVGDIVVDDCLENIKNAQAKYKILPLMFHNMYNEHNKKIYAGDAERDFVMTATAQGIQYEILHILSREGIGV